MVGAGQAFLCREGKRTMYCPAPDDPWSYYWIDCRGQQAKELLNKCGFADRDVIDMPLTEEMRQLLDMAVFRHVPVFLCGIFVALAGLLHEHSPMPQLNERERHVADAVDRIHACGGRITPARLAAELNLSRGYLRNLFVQYKGMSVMAYIMKWRMTLAADLLAQTEYPITVVARMAGYDDQLQFTRQFHKYYHCSPSRYRLVSRRELHRFNSVAAERAQGER